jgi:hypothetical protein
LRVHLERLAELTFRTDRIGQCRAQRATGLQQPPVILRGQSELLDRSGGLLLALPDEPSNIERISF